jgi:hypothetical protein
MVADTFYLQQKTAQPPWPLLAAGRDAAVHPIDLTCSPTASWSAACERPHLRWGTPWLWTLAFGHDEDCTPTHGCAATREAAMVAFAKLAAGVSSKIGKSAFAGKPENIWSL